MSLSAATIYFIACHGGAANHFAAYAEHLHKQHKVVIYAAGPAMDKVQHLREKDICVEEFVISEDEKKSAEELAQKCSKASIVITDVGHTFDIKLQQSLEKTPGERVAYYDNPEPYVPGGYSQTAAKVMQTADKVLFANKNLVETVLFKGEGQEIKLAKEKRVGLGYYPIEQAEVIAKQRQEKDQLRGELFKELKREDLGERVFVYTGGNNETYFKEALPACLEFFQGLSATEDLSNTIILLQQHPGAREEGRDWRLIEKWVDEQSSNPKAPLILLSPQKDTGKAVALADAVFYHQTSMAPQFALAKVPTIQIGKKPYRDLLVENGLCSVVNSEQGLLKALKDLEKAKQVSSAAVEKGLGIDPNWAGNLSEFVEKSISTN